MVRFNPKLYDKKYRISAVKVLTTDDPVDVNSALSPTELFYRRYRKSVQWDTVLNNILQSRVANVSSKFGRYSIQKGEPTRGFILSGTGQAFPRQVASEKMAHQISIASSKIPSFNRFPLAIYGSSAFNQMMDKARRIVSSKTGFIGPPTPESFYGPTLSDSTGFEYHATQARINQERIEEKRKLREKSLGASRENAEFRKNFIHDMMDDFEAQMHDEGKKYGKGRKGREKARQVWEKKFFEQYKWIKPIAKANPIIAKNLPAIAKALKDSGKIPILGSFIKHPAIAAATFMAMGAIKQASAFSATAKWANKELITGVPDLLTSSSMYRGLMSRSEQLNSWGKMASNLAGLKYGVGIDSINQIAMFSKGHPMTASLINSMFAGDQVGVRKSAMAIAKSLPVGERSLFLNAVGMSEGDYAAEYYKNMPTSKIPKNVFIASEIKRIADESIVELGSDNLFDFISGVVKGTSLGQAIIAGNRYRSIHPLSDAELVKRAADALLPFGIPSLFSPENAYSKSIRAAESLDAFKESEYSIGAGSTTNNETKTTIFRFDNVTIQANNVEDMTNQIMSMASGTSIGSMALMDYYDTRIKK